MVWINFVPEDSIEQVLFKFSGNNFYDLLNFFRDDINLFYDHNNKTWFCSPRYFIDSSLLKELQKIDEVSISEEVYSNIQYYSIPKLEIESKRKRYYEDVVNFTPIVGKKPNEDYQIVDIKRFLNINRGGIYWEQGLGKSVFLVVHLTQLFKNNEVDKAVILSPSSGIYNLRREILKFSNLFIKDDITIASKDNREPFNDTSKIVIMTYRTFLLISDHYHKKANPSSKSKKYRKACIPFDKWIKVNGVIYLDESHNIANPKARQTQVLHLHKKYFYYRYDLS